MNVGRILYPVEVLGPGKRMGIWLCGCDRGCKGCSNPELWKQRPEYEVSIDEIMMLVDKVGVEHDIDGFTISGGEPMDQVIELTKLIPKLIRYSTDILVYTGYQIEQLYARNDVSTEFILSNIAVLIDGEYREEENNDVLLRGSANQRIHVLSEKYEDRYSLYLSTSHNQIQNFTTSDGVVSVGIHKRGF